MEAFSEGRLLGGRVRCASRGGAAAGAGAVLLGAGIPARPGQRVLEGGCGGGAALPLPGGAGARAAGVGVERDPALAALAVANAAANGLAEQVGVIGAIRGRDWRERRRPATTPSPTRPSGPAAPPRPRRGASR